MPDNPGFILQAHDRAGTTSAGSPFKNTLTFERINVKKVSRRRFDKRRIVKYINRTVDRDLRLNLI